MLRGLANTVGLLTPVMEIISPSETHVRVLTLDGLAGQMQLARTVAGAMAALRERQAESDSGDFPGEVAKIGAHTSLLRFVWEKGLR